MALENFRTQKIIWDRANKKIFETIEANSGDSNGRKLVVQVINQETTEVLSGTTLSLGWKSRNGAKGLDAFNVVDASKGIFEIYYTTEMLSNIGNLEASLILIDSTSRIESSTFTISVRPSTVDDESVESENSFTALTEALVKVNDFDAQLAQKIGGGVKANLEIFDEETLNFIHDGTGGPIEIGQIPQNWSVSPIKTTFFDLSENLFNPNKVLENTIASPSGNIYDATRWLNNDFIPVELGDVIHISPQSAANRIFTFLSDKSYNGVSSGNSYTVVSSIVKFVKIASTTDYTKVMVNKGPQALPYRSYGDRLKEEHLPGIVDQKFREIDDLKENEKHVYYTVEYEEGNINADGSLGTSTQAYRPKAPIALDKGDLLKVSEGYRVFVVVKNKDGRIISAVWLPALSEYRAEESVIVHFMARTSENLKPETIDDFVIIKKSDNIVTFGELTSMPVAKNVKYVSLGGSDSNDGDSLSKAFKTLQKALDVGAETIYLQRGSYFNQSAKTTQPIDKLTILPADDGNEKVNFIGGDKLDGWVADGAIFKRTLAGGVNFDEVFISNVLPPMTATSRPAPNAVLWESLDFEIDYMMTPVLTLDECRLTQGTFYWDGSYIYINPKSISNDFWLPQIQNGIDLSNVKHLIGQDITANYYLNQSIRLESISKLDISGFEAHHSAKTDGFSLDYTYGDLANCKANKNRNDGYNNHIEGHVNLHNCEGINNFDDGASPHETCSMTVYGGIYRGNAKGGVIPANGATARVYNAVIEGNGKGFHNADTSLGKSISSGNLYIGNTIAIQNDNDNDFVSINDKFIDNVTDAVGTVDRY